MGTAFSSLTFKHTISAQPLNIYLPVCSLQIMVGGDGSKQHGFRAFIKEPPRNAGQGSVLHCVQGKRFVSQCWGVGSKDVHCYFSHCSLLIKASTEDEEKHNIVVFHHHNRQMVLSLLFLLGFCRKAHVHAMPHL